MFAVFPLRTIIFQCLFLLIAIAIEARVLQLRLALPYRTSVEYSTVINLLSTTIGWIAFFALDQLVPLEVKIQIIFFDRWISGTTTWIVPVGFFTFFSTFFVEAKGLDLLQLLLEVKTPQRQEVKASRITSSKRVDRSNRQSTDQAYTVLIANAFSYSAILILSILMRLPYLRLLLYRN